MKPDSWFDWQSELLHPGFSQFASVLIVAGMATIGLLILGGYRRSGGFTPLWLTFQAPVIGVAATSVFLFPLALSGHTNRSVLAFIALLLLTLGVSAPIWFLVTKWRKIRHFVSHVPWTVTTVVLIILLTGYVLLAFSPITDADSLDYHVGVAQQLVQNGSWPVRPEWFHSRIAGSGEVLIALGLAVGAEQVGALVQWAALLSISSLFIFLPNKNSQVKVWGALAFLSLPPLLALVSTPKPLLMPIALTAAALVLTVTALKPNAPALTGKQRLLALSIIGLLAMTAVNMKLSSVPGAALVLLFALGSMVETRSVLFRGVGILLVLFLIVLAPYLLWKGINFNGNLIDTFLKPFPGSWPGTGEFASYLKNYRDSATPLPLSLVKVDGLGFVTGFLGLALAITLVMSISRWTRIQMLLIGLGLMLTLAISLSSQATARFFIEPILWIWLALFVFGNKENFGARRFRWQLARFFIAVQVVLVLPLLLFGIVRSFPAVLSDPWRDKVMSQQANGWALMRWVDESLPTDAVFVSEHRSVGLSPRQFVPTDWRSYAGEGEMDSQVYLEITQGYEPTFALVFGADANSILESIPCAKSIHRGPLITKTATRNPLNSGAEQVAWLIRLKDGCYDLARMDLGNLDEN